MRIGRSILIELRCTSLYNRNNARCESGSSAVEFAIVSPILLMIVIGIIVYGLYFGAAHALQQMTAEAARSTVAGLTNAERSTLALRSVERALESSTLFRREDISVTVGDDLIDPDIYVVTLSFDSRAMGFAGVSRLVPMPPVILTRSMRVRRGGL